MRRELHRALDHVRADLDRVEILGGRARRASAQPIPDYEPDFRHMRQPEPSRTHGFALKATYLRAAQFEPFRQPKIAPIFSLVCPFKKSLSNQHINSL